MTHSGSDDFNFNSESSVNQNNLTSKSLAAFSSTNTSSSSTSPIPPPIVSSTTHAPSFHQVTSTTNNINNLTGFSSNLTKPIAPSPLLSKRYSISSTASPSPSINSSIGSTTINSTHDLPKPDQWLGQIVSSTSPIIFEGQTPRRAPSFGIHSRTLSLGSAESYSTHHRHQIDPFDAEWVGTVAGKPEQVGPSTNPFLVGNQPFQVQL